MPSTVTRTSTVPVPAGLVAMQLVVLLHCTLGDAVAPKVTIVAPAVMLKPVPVIVTDVPPAGVPVAGLSPVTVGTPQALPQMGYLGSGELYVQAPFSWVQSRMVSVPVAGTLAMVYDLVEGGSAPLLATLKLPSPVVPAQTQYPWAALAPFQVIVRLPLGIGVPGPGRQIAAFTAPTMVPPHSTATPSCVTVKVCPAIVMVPVRGRRCSRRR